MKNKNFVVIIPARGGSKRLLRKNIHLLNGLPLIWYVINAAKRSKNVERIIISTDDNEIAEVAKGYGAEVPFMRPKELATDSALSVDVIKHAMLELEKKEFYHVDYCVLLQVTNPIIKPEQIDKAIELVLEKKADSVVTISPIDNIDHPFNVRKIKEDGRVDFWQEKLHYEFKHGKKQYPKFYHVANLWISSYDTVVKNRRLEGEKNYPLVVDPIYSMDIDYKEDLEMIEAWFQYKEKN